MCFFFLLKVLDFDFKFVVLKYDDEKMIITLCSFPDYFTYSSKILNI